MLPCGSNGRVRDVELPPIRRISVLSAAPMEFGVIPHDHWYAPESIDEEKAANGRKKMEEDNIIYGGKS